MITEQKQIAWNPYFYNSAKTNLDQITTLLGQIITPETPKLGPDNNFTAHLFIFLSGKNFPKITLHVFVCDSENYMQKLSWNYFSGRSHFSCRKECFPNYFRNNFQLGWKGDIKGGHQGHLEWQVQPFWPTPVVVIRLTMPWSRRPPQTVLSNPPKGSVEPLKIRSQKRTTKPKNRTNGTKEFSEQFEGVTGRFPVKQGLWGKSHQKVHPNVRQNLCHTVSLWYLVCPRKKGSVEPQELPSNPSERDLRTTDKVLSNLSHRTELFSPQSIEVLSRSTFPL